MTQTYLGWDDNEYPWPPPDGWYQSADGKWWPDGYGPGPSVTPAPAPAPEPVPVAPPMENPAGFVGGPPPVAAPPPDPFSAPTGPPTGGVGVPPGAAVGVGGTGGGGGLGRVFLILGGLLVVLVIAGAGIFLLTRGDGDDEAADETVTVPESATDDPVADPGDTDEQTTTSTASTASTASTTVADTPESTTGGTGDGPGTFENPHVFGDAVTIFYEDFEGVNRSWLVEILEPARDGTQEVLDENQFNDPPPSGEVFAVARLRITYESGPAPGSVSELNLKAVGPSSVVLTWFGNYCGVVPDSLDTSAELFPGGSTEGNLCWSTAAGDIGNLTMLIDTFVAEGEIYLALQ